MLLTARTIAQKLEASPLGDDPLVVLPRPRLSEDALNGSASIDLRLGTWFLSPRARTVSLLDVVGGSEDEQSEQRLAKSAYVPFGDKYILHPGAVLLAATLEWVRLPSNMAAYVVGKSSWGRRGLIVATATGVHPHFSGCLTLELANVCEVPIAIYPGMNVCQLFIHQLDGPTPPPTAANFIGHRKPILGTLRLDSVATALGSHE